MNPNLGKYGKATQFKPGQSGNPAGRPKGALGVKNRIAKFLDKEVEPSIVQALAEHGITSEIKTREDALIAAMYMKGIGGDVKAVELILNRLYGKTKTEIEINTGVSEDKRLEISRKMRIIEEKFNE